MKPLERIAASARTLGFVAEKLARLVPASASGIAAATLLVGSLVRLTHTGRVQQYLAFALLGVAAAAAWLASS